jgi:hypothetical protein
MPPIPSSLDSDVGWYTNIRAAEILSISYTIPVQTKHAATKSTGRWSEQAFVPLLNIPDFDSLVTERW